MSARRPRGRPRARTRPGPELVAVAFVVVLYALGLGLGPAIIAGGSVSTVPTTPPASDAAPSPAETVNPLRGEIAAILEVDARLIANGTELHEILGAVPFRGSEVAFALRRIKPTLLAGAERVGRLASEPATEVVGAQLEILYASANDAVDRASDLALGSDAEYRETAREIVRLFSDLPAIDRRLEALLESGTLDPSQVPPASPSSMPSSSASALPSLRTASPSPSPSELGPREMLRDPGFETVTGAWSLRTTGGSQPAVHGGAPLGTTGTRSIRIEVPAVSSLADVGVGQGPIQLKARTTYIASVWIRATEPRSAQLRVVGPTEETHGIALIEIGPEAVQARLEIRPLGADEPAATFWIDLGGDIPGTVELDDASFVEEPIG